MVDDQDQPIKLVAFGNVVHGVFAFGNVARGIFAFGSGISIGVFAFGTNAVGTVLAVGINAAAPISIGLANAGGIFAFALANAFGAFGKVGVNGAYSPYAAFVFGAVLLVIQWLLPKPPPRIAERVLVTLEEIEGREYERGWVAARLEGKGESAALVVAGHKGFVPLTANVVERADGKSRAVAALVTTTTTLVPNEGDYRSPAREERELVCCAVEPLARELRISSVYRGSLIASAVAAFASGALALALTRDVILG
jgi:hypothetical protein